MTELKQLTPGNSQSWLEANDEVPHTIGVSGATAAVLSARSPDKDTCNEDAALVLAMQSGSTLLMVADGCGGMASGELAARLTLESVLSSVLAANPEESLRSAILDGIESANREVMAVGTGSATTLVAALIEENQVRTFHVGDSQAILVGGRGKVKLLTKAHSPVGYALESGIINEREAIEHEDRHLVSNLIGVEEMHVEIGPTVPLAQRDMLLLASDGLWDNMFMQEVVDATCRGPALHVATRLAGAAWQRMHDQPAGDPGKPDDLTLIALSRR
ncbi:PP2C family protein-serine/threonine phosphatase [Adhaeretor mobilis]|uniref:Serine/threonine phosphatase stp n=1 Tax=Adhaeretor mobilis TaxID=1930276 RepID=A0A517N1J8_9BACT|nr:protein phosphatase 2C domain-containing protein [Adhaeretor mobilis]QDT01007.1 Serine/threonine phosphatase stp [Adhaeretor mobilis]